MVPICQKCQKAVLGNLGQNQVETPIVYRSEKVGDQFLNGTLTLHARGGKTTKTHFRGPKTRFWAPVVKIGSETLHFLTTIWEVTKPRKTLFFVWKHDELHNDTSEVPKHQKVPKNTKKRIFCWFWHKATHRDASFWWFWVIQTLISRHISLFLDPPAKNSEIRGWGMLKLPNSIGRKYGISASTPQ